MGGDDGAKTATRKMDADQFRELVQQGSRGPRAPTVQASPALIDELVARSATPDPDDDLAIPVAPRAESKPIKKPAVTASEPRPERRHARAIAPITKPPELREPARPRAPTTGPRPSVLIALVIAILAAITIFVLRST